MPLHTPLHAIASSRGRLTAFVSLAAGTVLAPACARAQRTRAAVVPSVQQWMSLENADSPALSPDGEFVVYRRQRADWQRHAYVADLWRARVATGERRLLAGGEGSSWAPAWSPDGRRVAFLSSRSGTAQVYVVAAGGQREPVSLTHANDGVDGFRWSPDGRRIGFTAGEAVPRRDSATSVVLGRAAEAPEYHLVGNDRPYSAALWVVTVPEPAAPAAATPPPAERVTNPVDFAVDDAFSWSPDGRRIAFSANRYDAPEPFWTYDLYVADVAAKAVRRLVADRGPQFFPLWSPDGRRIAFKTFVTSPDEDYHLYSIGYVATVPADGGPSRVLTADFDENLTPLAWAADGIYFAARQRASSHLFRVRPPARGGERPVVERVTEPAAAIKTAFSFSRDYRRVAFLGQDSARYQEVYVAPLSATARPTRVTAMGDQLTGWAVGTREVVHWTSRDGTPVEGVLVKPADYDPSRTYPLLVIVHTGPLEADQPTVSRDFPYPADLFAARGVLVLRPNYRGSIGYGARFRAALVRNQGVPQVEDVVAGVDLLVRRGLVDSARVGAAGWSAGGYVVAMAGVWSDRFRAVSMLETSSDWRIFYTAGAGGQVRPDYAQATPWHDPDYYRVSSPLTYVARARTPTLIQHGDADRTAPLVGAQELYRALKDRGVPVEMVVFPGMGHVPSDLRQARAVTEQNLAWFGHWLFDAAPTGQARAP